jgi:hypothetical protein
MQAMRHPRRNEVYRDVGSDPHDPSDLDFIDIEDIPFEPDAALLLCSDGLTDLVDSSAIGRTVRQLSGHPDAVVAALVDAANAAGGKDNVTVVYVEGEQFSSAQSQLAATPSSAPQHLPAGSHAFAGLERRKPMARLAVAALVIAAIGVAYFAVRGNLALLRSLAQPSTPSAAGKLVVNSSGSIAEVMRDAMPGAEIIVDPGEYREQLVLKDGVRLVSRVPRGATIRLPAAVADAENVPAIVARDVSGAELIGFKISGDSATPLAIGVSIRNSIVSIADVEITGATTAAVEFSGGTGSSLLASEIRDNPGAALVIRDGGAPRIGHSALSRNGTSAQAPGAVVVQAGSAPVFHRNVFTGMNVDGFVGLDTAAQLTLKRDNWFLPLADAPPRQGNGGQDSAGRRSRAPQQAPRGR